MADLIDRKSVIDVIHKAIFDFFDIVDDDDESPMTYKDEQLLTLNKAIVTKIKALPSAQPDVPDTNVGDMISRQAAIDEAYAVIVDDAVYDVVQVETLEALPSTERHGKWLEHKDYPGLAYLCSKCNWFTTDRSFYCPHCGARMDGE